MPSAPAGSRTARVSSKASRTAAQISSSLTTTMSSTSSLHNRKTSLPSWRTEAPSTKCAGSGTETVWPCSSERCSKSAELASTPMTFVRGITLFMIAAMPARRDEPPPTTKMASSSPCASCRSWAETEPICLIISRAVVAWPAMTAGSSCGSIIVTSGFSLASRWATACDSLRVVPATSTVAPVRSIAARRLTGVRCGMTTVALMPRSCAATATEWPCEPTEYVTTSALSSGKLASRL
mmetsp:Transcript_7308/g.14901  ORF Transcript_7308/g.14901 Transcript_7308/m.14901 type:complete len:238 (+) Transcript_7308:1044-1757(+)